MTEAAITEAAITERDAIGRALAQAGVAGSGAQAELGPLLPSRIAVYHTAIEVAALARIAMDLTCSSRGHHVDVRRAAAQLDKMRAVLGPLVAGAPGGDC